MSDTETPPSNGGGNGESAGAGNATGDAAAQQPQPNVRLLAHFVRDLSFENVGAIEGKAIEGQPEINVAVNLEANGIGENRYQTLMKINATAKAGDQTRFVVELEYAGIFSIDNVPREHIHPFIFIECPRQILPFARRVVSDATRDGGYPPLMIDNVDFALLYRQKLEQMKTEREQSETPAN